MPLRNRMDVATDGQDVLHHEKRLDTNSALCNAISRADQNPNVRRALNFWAKTKIALCVQLSAKFQNRVVQRTLSLSAKTLAPRYRLPPHATVH